MLRGVVYGWRGVRAIHLYRLFGGEHMIMIMSVGVGVWSDGCLLGRRIGVMCEFIFMIVCLCLDYRLPPRIAQDQRRQQ